MEKVQTFTNYHAIEIAGKMSKRDKYFKKNENFVLLQNIFQN